MEILEIKCLTDAFSSVDSNGNANQDLFYLFVTSNDYKKESSFTFWLLSTVRQLIILKMSSIINWRFLTTSNKYVNPDYKLSGSSIKPPFDILLI